jgi:hypothetical protein
MLLNKDKNAVSQNCTTLKKFCQGCTDLMLGNQQFSETSAHIYQITRRHIPPWKPQVPNFTELKIHHQSHSVFFTVITRKRTQTLQNSAPEPTTEDRKPTAFWRYIPSYGYFINQSSELCSRNPLPSSQWVSVLVHVKADPRLCNWEKTYLR